MKFEITEIGGSRSCRVTRFSQDGSLISRIQKGGRDFLVSVLSLAACLSCPLTRGADTELTNYKSGIDVTWGGVKGTAYQEEYWFHDKLISDTKQVWIRSDTPITMGHNARNVASIGGSRDKSVVGAAGGGQIRYKIDGLWQELQWAPKWDGSGTLYPAYSSPFTVASTGVVGISGWSGAYWRGMVDSVGDEWHVLMYADDDRALGGFDDAWASDGKWTLLVVNPKTPAMTVRASGTGQFYTTPAWTYWVPKIHDQTTYFQGTCTFELNNLYGTNISYRINGGSTVAAGAATVTLNEGNFNSGSNTLEYWYDSSPLVKRKRTLVKNPAYPSAGESHGDRVWGSSDKWTRFNSRALRAPYSAVITKSKTATAESQTEWDAKSRQGLRFGGANWPHKNNYISDNAILAKYLGFDAVRSGGSKPYAAYAREKLLESPLVQSTVGYETSYWASMPIPCSDVVYRGYWDVNFAYDAAIAYDVLINGYRSDQIAGGITPIEDYFLRDRLASWCHLCAIRLGGFVEPSLGMWGTCRAIGATMITVVMPKYSTPYYGTSGMDGNTAVFQWAPFQTNNYTWKQLFVDHNYPLAAVGQGPAQLFGLEGSVESESIIRPPGSAEVWVTKPAYASMGQCGHSIYNYANLQKIYAPGNPHPNLDNFLDQITRGTLMGAVDPKGPERQHAITVLNDKFPVPVANAGSWVKSLPSSDPNSDDSGLADAGLLGLFWYDDGNDSGTPPPTVVSNPTALPAGGNYSAPQSVSISTATSGAAIYFTTDGSTPTSGSPLYTTPIAISTNTTLKAIATKSGMTNSAVMSSAYSFTPPPTGSVSQPTWPGATIALSPAQTESFAVSIKVIPSANNIDAQVALSNGPPTGYAALAVIGRFNSAGRIDAANDNTYTAMNVLAYSSGVVYTFDFTVNMVAKSYSLKVTPAGGDPVVIAENYAFRTTASSDQLTHLVIHHDASSSGKISADNITITKKPTRPEGLRIVE